MSDSNRSAKSNSYNWLRHLVEQPFVFATGAAAFVHSTSILATIFAGHEPSFPSGEWFAWMLPAALIAFALDVGQIATSAEIRQGQRSKAKYATFAIFAIGTYFLQWLYLVHHIPALALGAGVSSFHAPFVQALSDLAIYIVPALLPASTLLYTFSQSSTDQPADAIASQNAPIIQPVQPTIEVVPPDALAMPPILQAPAVPQIAESVPESVAIEVVPPDALVTSQRFLAICECGWQKECETERSKTNSLTAHRRGCKLAKVAQ